MSKMTLEDWRSHALSFEQELNQVVLGLSPAIRLLIISIFARGHVLLECNVGVGKRRVKIYRFSFLMKSIVRVRKCILCCYV